MTENFTQNFYYFKIFLEFAFQFFSTSKIFYQQKKFLEFAPIFFTFFTKKYLNFFILFYITFSKFLLLFSSNWTNLKNFPTTPTPTTFTTT